MRKSIIKGRAGPATIVLGLLLAVPFPSLAEEVTGKDLKRALEEKDRQVLALMERLERLEQQTALKPTPPAETPSAPAAASSQPLTLAAAEEQTFNARIKKAFDELFEKAPALSFLKDVQLSGYLTATYNFNFNDPVKSGTGASRRNDFRYFDLEANQFTFNMAELQLVKPSTEESPFGFGLTLNAGNDARKIHAAGLGSDLPLGFTNQAFDLRQAYVTYKAPLGRGLDVKAGKFDTLIGLEVVPSPANPNISRSLLFNWSPPFTHVGVLFSYPFTDWLAATAGVVNGWDVADDNNDAKTFIGQISLTPLSNLTLTLNAIGGPEQPDNTSNYRWLADFVLTYTPLEPLTIYLSGDIGRDENALGPDQDVRWWGIEGIAVYRLTDRLSVAFRAEYFRDEDGGKAFKDLLGPDSVAFVQSLWEVTATVKYKLTDHFYTRLEYRHDGSSRDTFRDGNSSQDTISVEVGYVF